MFDLTLRDLLKHWKTALFAVLALFLLWAFTPSCATRKGMEAAAEAKAAVEMANQHKEIRDAATKAALEETERRKVVQQERDALAQDKADLTGQVARLRKALPPRPVVGSGTGVPGSTPGVVVGGVANLEECRALVTQLYEVVDAQAALIAKHEEDDKKEAEFIASLERSEAKWREAAEAGAAESEALRRALREKEIQIDAMKWSNVKAQARAGVAGALLWELARTFLLKR